MTALAPRHRRAEPGSGETRLANLRDLGGTPVTGGVLRHGALLRSDDVSRATALEAQQLVAAGLTTVIDLRSPGEVATAGRGPLAWSGVQHHHLPLLPRAGMPAGLVAHLTGSEVTPAEMGRWYAMVTLASAPLIVDALGIIAHAPGTVLVHCTAGKDRAGIVTAAVLTVLGAPHEAVVADYALTSAAMPEVRARLGLASVAADVAVLVDAHPETMQQMLTVLDREHGGLPEVLREAGLAVVTEARLRQRLVLPLSPASSATPPRPRPGGSPVPR